MIAVIVVFSVVGLLIIGCIIGCCRRAAANRNAKKRWPGMTVDEMQTELQGIKPEMPACHAYNKMPTVVVEPKGRRGAGVWVWEKLFGCP